MHLEQALSVKKLAAFVAEHGKTHPVASKHHFHAILKSAASGKSKPKPEHLGRVLWLTGTQIPSHIYANAVAKHECGAPDTALEMLPKVLQARSCDIPRGHTVSDPMLNREMCSLSWAGHGRKAFHPCEPLCPWRRSLNQSHQQLLFAVRDDFVIISLFQLQHPEHNRFSSGTASEGAMPFLANESLTSFNHTGQRETPHRPSPCVRG